MAAVPTAPAPPVDQNGLPLDVAVREQAAMRGQRRHAQTGADFERYVAGQRNGLPGRNHGMVRCGTKGATILRFEQPYPLADACRCHVGTHRVNHAGTVLMRNDQRKCGRPGKAGTRLDIARVQAGRMDPHPNFAGPRLWYRKLAELQHVGCLALPFVIGRFHQSRSLNKRRRRQSTTSATKPGLSAADRFSTRRHNFDI